jgi:lipopolysaccharide biosynthesis glycosyltransferase
VLAQERPRLLAKLLEALRRAEHGQVDRALLAHLVLEIRVDRYEKIGIVDSDTMIRWDAPNIFDQFNIDDFCGVNDLCDLNWLFESIGNRQQFFPNTKLYINQYLNAGVLFFGSKYLYVFKELLDFYLSNRSEIDSIKTGGKEQTLLNFVLQQSKVKIKLISPAWNLLSIHRKNMFTHNWQLNIDPMPYFMKYAYIWHFTGFPIENRVNVMRQTWESTKHLYE